MKYIDVEPRWEVCARIFMELVSHPKDAEAHEVGVKGLMDMARTLDEVRQAQKAQEKAGKDNTERFIDYEAGDYLLIDENNQIQGVSGNSEFWDVEDGLDDQFIVDASKDVYTIVKVMRVHKDGSPWLSTD
jgi:hypothetical protein